MSDFTPPTAVKAMEILSQQSVFPKTSLAWPYWFPERLAIMKQHPQIQHQIPVSYAIFHYGQKYGLVAQLFSGFQKETIFSTIFVKVKRV